MKLKDIKTLLDISNKVKQGKYTRLDIESIEALVPDTINSEYIDVKDIPMTESDTHRDIIINRLYSLNSKIEDVLVKSTNDSINRVTLLVKKLLFIRDILVKVKTLEVKPVDNIDKIYIYSDETGASSLRDNTFDYALGKLNNGNEFNLLASNDKEVDKSILELQYRLFTGVLYDIESSEWNGYILKNMLDVQKVTFNVIASLLSNPMPMIKKIDDLIDKILLNVSNATNFISGFQGIYDYDASLEACTSLDYMSFMDPTINVYINDTTSPSIIELLSKVIYKDLQ